ncbi:MAG: anhydro-N-acetylmuramic acid kinase [Bacteroidia bacterium]
MIKENNKYKVIGLMSGTSLDGLDIAYCEFALKGKKWSYKVLHAETVAYHKGGKDKLKNAHLATAEELCELHTDFGLFIGEKVLKFIRKNKIKNVDFISSHGHTIFHQPLNHFTLQIGDGATIAAVTGIKTICDFRSTDVALGGQGAPLVPIGDELLFSDYDACLNIGGIANISFKQKGKRIAFDICPANLLFNHLAKQVGHEYDNGGKLAASGHFNDILLKKFNSLSYYKSYKSKSLGREDVERDFISVLENSKIPVKDKLATVSEHAAFQTARVLNNFKIKNVLVTGGGAYNSDFLSRINAYSDCKIHVTDDKTIQFKEALIFAFLGVLRTRNEVNALRSVTGAKRDSCGGAIYG